jgi:hypothetical protein
MKRNEILKYAILLYLFIVGYLLLIEFTTSVFEFEGNLIAAMICATGLSSSHIVTFIGRAYGRGATNNEIIRIGVLCFSLLIVTVSLLLLLKYKIDFVMAGTLIVILLVVQVLVYYFSMKFLPKIMK